MARSDRARYVSSLSPGGGGMGPVSIFGRPTVPWGDMSPERGSGYPRETAPRRRRSTSSVEGPTDTQIFNMRRGREKDIREEIEKRYELAVEALEGTWIEGDPKALATRKKALKATITEEVKKEFAQNPIPQQRKSGGNIWGAAEGIRDMIKNKEMSKTVGNRLIREITGTYSPDPTTIGREGTAKITLEEGPEKGAEIKQAINKKTGEMETYARKGKKKWRIDNGEWKELRLRGSKKKTPPTKKMPEEPFIPMPEGGFDYNTPPEEPFIPMPEGEFDSGGMRPQRDSPYRNPMVGRNEWLDPVDVNEDFDFGQWMSDWYERKSMQPDVRGMRRRGY